MPSTVHSAPSLTPPPLPLSLSRSNATSIAPITAIQFGVAGLLTEAIAKGPTAAPAPLLPSCTSALPRPAPQPLPLPHCGRSSAAACAPSPSSADGRELRDSEKILSQGGAAGQDCLALLADG